MGRTWTGDDKSRFCGQCRTHVYNFSAMSADEAAELIRREGGKLCGRFYRAAMARCSLEIVRWARKDIFFG